MRDWIEKRVHLALNGFMSLNVDVVSTGYQPAFDCWMLPCPTCRHTQWDHGDVTSRALVAWRYARCMTGQTTTGLEIEKGLQRHLESVLHPETGLAFVPEHSDPKSSQFYYHMWDQGRVLDYFARQLELLPSEHPQRVTLLEQARRLQRGMRTLACQTTLPDKSKALHWPSDVFWNREPRLPENRDFGDQNWHGWCIVTSQLLGPQAMLASVTGDSQDLEFAIQIANGFLAGLEHRRGSQSPLFSDTGSFRGHFHSVTSGLVGLIQLAKQIWDSPRNAQARRWIELARQVYDWIYDSEHNVNAASTCGYFPETARDEIHSNSELCGAADMMELAAELASCANLDSIWNSWSDLWDDLERICVNEIRLNQMTDPQKLMAWARLDHSVEPTDAITQLERQQGSWIACRNYVCDLATYDDATFLDAALSSEQTGLPFGQPKLSAGGCCAYSGVRAYWTAWSESVITRGDETEIRIPTSYEHSAIEIKLIHDGLLQIQTNKDHQLKMRLPTRMEPESLKVTGLQHRDECIIKSRWVYINLSQGSDIQIQWAPLKWERIECTGPTQRDNLLEGVAPNVRPTYTLKYCGNRLIDIQPQGVKLPYLKGI